jgi:HEAT repeat protein
MVLDSKGELRYEAGRLLRTYAAEESSKQLREILASPQEEVYSMTIEMLGEIHRTV